MIALDDRDIYTEAIKDFNAGPSEFLENFEYEQDHLSCKKREDFEDLGTIGQGTFGVVYKCREKTSRKYYALKQIKLDQDKEGVCK